MAVRFDPELDPIHPPFHNTETVETLSEHIGIGNTPTVIESMNTDGDGPDDPSACNRFLSTLKNIPSQIISFFQWLPTKIGICINSLSFVRSTDITDEIQERLTQLETFSNLLKNLGPNNRFQTVRQGFEQLSEEAQKSFHNIDRIKLAVNFRDFNNPESGIVENWIHECDMLISWTRFFAERLRRMEFEEPVSIQPPVQNPVQTPVQIPQTVVVLPPPPPPPTHNSADLAEEIERLIPIFEAIPGHPEAPDEFMCPISADIMHDPVKDACEAHGAAHFFEREDITDYLNRFAHRRCPVNMQPIPVGEISDAPLLQIRIVEWLTAQTAGH